MTESVSFFLCLNGSLWYEKLRGNYSSQTYTQEVLPKLQLPEHTKSEGNLRHISLEGSNQYWNVTIGYRWLVVSIWTEILVDPTDSLASLREQASTLSWELGAVLAHVASDICGRLDTSVYADRLVVSWEKLDRYLDVGERSAFLESFVDLLWPGCRSDIWGYSEGQLIHKTHRDKHGLLPIGIPITDSAYDEVLLCQDIEMYPHLWPIAMNAKHWLEIQLSLHDIWSAQEETHRKLDDLRKKVKLGGSKSSSTHLHKEYLKLSNELDILDRRSRYAVDEYRLFSEYIREPQETARGTFASALVTTPGFPVDFVRDMRWNTEAMDVVSDVTSGRFGWPDLRILENDIEALRIETKEKHKKWEAWVYSGILTIGFVAALVCSPADWLGFYADYLQIFTFIVLVTFLWLYRSAE